MTKAPKILALSGSLRTDSWNRLLLGEAVAAAERDGAQVSIVNLQDYPLPLLNTDNEKEMQKNAHLEALKSLLSECDGLIIASPEYNGSLSAALKNTLDWLSRPGLDGSYKPAFEGKVVGMLSASPSNLGGTRGLSHLRDVLTSLGCLVTPKQVSVSAAYKAFNEQGDINDSATLERVEKAVKGVTLLVRQRSQSVV